jgi:hypothetical protein
MMRTIYEGGASVAENDYTHTELDEATDDYVDVPIPGLDERVSSRSKLTFTLDYPFDRPYQGELITDAGPTLRQVIDAIRAGFRVMYRGAAESDIPGFINKRVEGAYGVATHVIGDLVIEAIDLDDETGRLDIGIGS